MYIDLVPRTQYGQLVFEWFQYLITHLSISCVSAYVATTGPAMFVCFPTKKCLGKKS